MVQLGKYPAPSHSLVHFSDPHFLGGNRPLYGSVDTVAALAESLAQLESSGAKPLAIVFTGDLADLGEPDAYRLLRATVEPVAARMGSRIIWVMGNHDEREPFRAGLLSDRPVGEGEATKVADPVAGVAPADAVSADAVSAGAVPAGAVPAGAGQIPPPEDAVYDLDGLRVIVLDTSVPGFHHGDLDEAQLEWLAVQLENPAPHGTLLAMHHPPIPTPLELMAVLELRHQDELADVIRGTDVRGILAGHLHYSTHSTYAGVPVSVSAATCYLLDVAARRHTMVGRAGGQAFSLVDVWPEQIVHSIVPVGDRSQVSGFSARFLAGIERMSPAERLEAISRKSSTTTVADVEQLAGHPIEGAR